MSFARYPLYRDSGVEWLGRVPAHWNSCRLGHYFTERREKVSDTEYPPLSVTQSGIVPQIETAAKTDDNDNRKRVCRGDFVINSRSDRRGSAGVAYVNGSVSLINIVLTPNGGIHPRFAHHLLRSRPFQEEYYRFGKGIVADLWSTNYSEMRNITLAVPPAEEQLAIAALVDKETAKLDALVAEQRRLIALLREKRQAVTSHAVTRGLNVAELTPNTGDPHFGSAPPHWRVCALRRAVARIEQGWSPECENRPADDGEWGVLKAGCVNRGIFDATQNKALPAALEPVTAYEVREGDLLMSRASGSPELIGSAAVVRGVRPGLMLSDKIFRLRLAPGMISEYFALLLGTPALRHQIEGAISGAGGLANNLPQTALLAFSVVVPPAEEQQRIVAHLAPRTAALDSGIVEVERAVALLQERRTALIAAAVTGQIDVRAHAEPRAEPNADLAIARSAA